MTISYEDLNQKTKPQESSVVFPNFQRQSSPVKFSQGQDDKILTVSTFSGQIIGRGYEWHTFATEYYTSLPVNLQEKPEKLLIYLALFHPPPHLQFL